jgi:hypothetical protein
MRNLAGRFGYESSPILTFPRYQWIFLKELHFCKSDPLLYSIHDPDLERDPGRENGVMAGLDMRNRSAE